jgi:hypothetical protein
LRLSADDKGPKPVYGMVRRRSPEVVECGEELGEEVKRSLSPRPTLGRHSDEPGVRMDRDLLGDKAQPARRHSNKRAGKDQRHHLDAVGVYIL